MEDKIYQWKRFWCPWDKKYKLSGDGYLEDIDSNYGIMNPDILSFEMMAGIHCLILLWEPGIGKTTSVKAEIERLKREKKENEQVLYRDLGKYGNELILYRGLFEHQVVKNWIENNEEVLYLFLDSLDECSLHIETISSFLIDEFNNISSINGLFDRLYIRIICRITDWQLSLEKELTKLWDKEPIKLYKLAPLRLCDVELATKDNNLDSVRFLQTIAEKEISALAIYPVTLGFLIKEFSNKKEFPDNKTELFYRGCLELCNESNLRRQDTGLAGELTCEQRLAVASRIAFITIFTNKNKIYGNDFITYNSKDCLNLSELYGYIPEKINGQKVEINQNSVKETLSTGLFEKLGEEFIVWKHKSHQEFLAAWYLFNHQNNLEILQIVNLVKHPEGKIIPQLYETVAWFASMNPEFFRKILEIEPEILLLGDLVRVSEEDRRDLVSELLNLFDCGKIIKQVDLNHYKKLKNKYLEEQIKSYICKNDSEAQIAAINIVEACKLDTFQKDLITLVLDSSEEITIREMCIYALLHIADEQTKIKLKSLITEQPGEDPDDELKGCAFQLLWPDYLTTEELFDNLTIPKKQGLVGFYYMFIRYKLCNQLSVKDLPVALIWLERNMSPELFLISHAFNELIETIILKTSENLDNQELFDVFSRVILSNIDNYNFRNLTTFLRDKWSKDKKQRRDLLLSLIPKISDNQETIRELSMNGLIYNEDFTWLIDQIKASKEDKDRKKWAYLIQIATRWNKEEQEIIMQLGEDYQIIKDVFPYLYKNREEQSVKEYNNEVYSQKENDNNIKAEDDKEFRKDLLKKIENDLEEIEKGNLEHWLHLTRNLSMMPGKNYYLDPLQNTDITKLPAWELINEDIKKDIIKAAEIFILKRQTETDKLLGTNKYIPLDWAGYKALILLLKTFGIKIPKDIWKNWASVIIVYPNGNEDLEIRQHLIEQCYREAPDKIISSLICLIEKENKEDISCISLFIDKLKHCWDEKLSDKLLQELNSKNLKAEVITPILSMLLEKRIDGARDFAEQLIQISDFTDKDNFNKAVSAAFLLIMKEEDCGWEIVWPAMNKNEGFAKNVILKLSQELGLYDKHKDFFLRLGEDELAELFIKIYQFFGYSDDTDFRYRQLMGYLLEYLKKLGNEESCKALEYIVTTIPDNKWLKEVLFEAKINFLRETWKPLMPSDLLNFVKDKSSRIVQSGEQLLDVVIESLKRFEKKLRGETPSVIFLWNKDYRTYYVIEEEKINKLRSEDNIDISYLKEKVFLKKYIEYKFDGKEIVDKIIEKSNKFNKKDSWWPKWENEFSDFVKLHLDNDLEKRKIVVNREVKINRGDKTDIYVQAVEEGEKPFCVIIEVKGCWNKNLDDAMETQLVEQYIKTHENCQLGLYLVAWFYCDQWDNEDTRKDKNPISIEEARNKFNKQAEELSKENLTIKAFVMNTALE